MSDPVLVAGAGIGGLAAALALAREGFQVKVLEQSAQLGEIGAGVQLGPNAFAAFDALGIGEQARGRAVYTERMEMIDAIDESVICSVPFGTAFRQRFGNPYAVMHRADVHGSLLEAVQATDGIELATGTRVERIEHDSHGVTVTDAAGLRHAGAALIGCDGVRSAVRHALVGDAVRVSGHVVYRAVVDAADFPADLRINAPVVWAGPNCHLVHYPLRGGEQFNLVVTFHSRGDEEWGVKEGSASEVQSYFQGIAERPRRLLGLPKSWKRWATADREPIGQWTFGRCTLLGDAAHPLLQYLAQGACMALEDAATLGAALRAHRGDARRGAARAPRRPGSGARALRALARHPHRPRRPHDARDGPYLSRPRRRAAGAQRPLEGPHAGALLRRARMAVRLARRALPGRGLSDGDDYVSAGPRALPATCCPASNRTGGASAS